MIFRDVQLCFTCTKCCSVDLGNEEVARDAAHVCAVRRDAGGGVVRDGLGLDLCRRCGCGQRELLARRAAAGLREVAARGAQAAPRVAPGTTCAIGSGPARSVPRTRNIRAARRTRHTLVRSLRLQLFIASDITFSSNLAFRTHFCRSVIREQFVVALLRHTLSVCSVPIPISLSSLAHFDFLWPTFRGQSYFTVTCCFCFSPLGFCRVCQ